MSTRRMTKAQLERTVAELRIGLEKANAVKRSLLVQLERAEQDRDRAMMRLDVCAEEVAILKRLVAVSGASRLEEPDGGQPVLRWIEARA